MLRRAFLVGLASLLPAAAVASILPPVDHLTYLISERRIARRESGAYRVPRAECWHITSQKKAAIYFPDGTVEEYDESELDFAVRRAKAHNIEQTGREGAMYHEFTDGRAPTAVEALVPGSALA